MLTFHNDQKVKDKYIARIKAHAAADEIIKGDYWEGGKGCAVGCTIHGYNHEAYETELGIPQLIAHIEDAIFEGLPNDVAKEFPLRFLDAVPVGVDLEKAMVLEKFMLWLLVDENFGVYKYGNIREKKAVKAVATLYERRIAGDSIDANTWNLAKIDAYDIGDTAAGAAAAIYAAGNFFTFANAVYVGIAIQNAAYVIYGATANSYVYHPCARTYANDAMRIHYISQANKLIELLIDSKQALDSTIGQ